MIPGFFSQQSAMNALSAADPYWPYVVSQNNWPGMSGSTTFTDDTGKTWTGYGNAQIDTTYGQGVVLDGAGDYLTTPDSADFTLGSNIFSEEGFFVEAVRGPVRQLIGQHTTDSPSNGDCSFLILSDNGYLKFQVFAAGTFFTVANPSQHPLDTLHHYAAGRDAGGVFRLKLNGVQVDEITLLGSTLNSSAQPLTIGSVMTFGSPHAAGLFFNGRVLARRLMVGANPYPGAGSFTPPTPPFPTS